MHPTLFHIGDSGIPAFFFMIMVAALASTFVAVKFAKKEGLSEVVILDMAIIAVIASILGSRIFHIIFEAPDYYLEKPIRVFYFWQGGFVSLGAFICSVLGWIIYLKLKKCDMWRYIDVAALAVPIIKFFVRLGCLLVGCCFGRPTDSFLGIKFTNPDSTAFEYYPGVAIFPTQIFNMVNAVIMFGVLYFVYKRRKFKGQVLAVFLIYYAVTRFVIEFFRGDVDRGMYFNNMLSTGQLVMILTLAIGIVTYVVLGKKAKKAE